MHQAQLAALELEDVSRQFVLAVVGVEDRVREKRRAIRKLGVLNRLLGQLGHHHPIALLPLAELATFPRT